MYHPRQLIALTNGQRPRSRRRQNLLHTVFGLHREPRCQLVRLSALIKAQHRRQVRVVRILRRRDHRNMPLRRDSAGWVVLPLRLRMPVIPHLRRRGLPNQQLRSTVHLFAALRHQ